MSVESFTTYDFHNVLLKALIKIEKETKADYFCEPLGLVQGEQQFKISVKKLDNGSEVNILVNSSIDESGVSAPSGDNSIRGWLANEDGNSLGSKTQRWVTRQPGWQDRLESMVRALIEVAGWVRYCKACNSLEKIYKVVKEGANKGRSFRKCNCEGSFEWVIGGKTQDDSTVPTCPNCDVKMMKRKGKYGEFWGCSNFPRCKGTRNIGQEDLEPKDYQDRKNALAKKTDKPTPSSYQQALFDWVDNQFDPEFADIYIRDHGQNLMVEACAGSGKTTTGKWMFERMPVSFGNKQLKMLSVTFAKKNAVDLAKVLPPRVKARTNHSLGYMSCVKGLGITKDSVDDDKVLIILKEYADYKDDPSIPYLIKNIVGKVKSTLGSATKANLDDITDYYNIPLNGNREAIYDAVKYVMKRSKELTNIIDFADMVWLPVVLDLPCETYDVIFLDEAQDTNPLGLALLLKHCHEGTKFIAVGDTFQSIYAFRGSDRKAMETIRKALDAPIYGLPISYRSPKSAVRMINEMYPEIPFEAAPNAIEGEIVYSRLDDVIDDVKSGDLFLCRMNAPLVQPCFRLIANGIKAVILGKDIGTGLIMLIKKMRADDYYDLHHKLTAYREREVLRLLDAKREVQAQEVKDKVHTIISVAEAVQVDEPTVDDVISKIQEIFTDKEEGVIFSTIHKAKGSQAERVTLIKSELCPHPKAESETERRQEFNMDYVSRTRHTHKLTILTD